MKTPLRCFVLFAALGTVSVPGLQGAPTLDRSDRDTPEANTRKADPAPEPPKPAPTNPPPAKPAPSKPAPVKEGAAPPSPAIGEAGSDNSDLALPELKKLDPVPDNLFAEVEKSDPDQPIVDLSAEALEAYVTFFPARSTRIGVSTYDAFLGDYRKTSIAAFLGSCKGYLARADKLDPKGFTERGRIERDALRVHLRSMIRTLETLSAPTRDPNFYVDESVGAIQEVIDRDETVGLKRIDHLMSRLSILPSFFMIARQNLETCPRPAVLRAIVRLRGSAPLFQKTVLQQIQQSGHPAATTVGGEAVAGAWKQVATFAEWLEKEKLPRSTSPAPLGDKGWREWLAAREETGLSPSQVLAAVEADLTRSKEELRALASGAFPGKTPAQAVAEISAERLEPADARKSAETTIGHLWEWMIQSRPTEPPSDEMTIEVRETPAFRRRDAPVKTDLPGGYAALEAPSFLEIAAPNPDWPSPILASWLSEYGRWFLPVSLAREVYPGRFLAWQAQRKSRIRTCRAVKFPAAWEGWTLYAEELAVRGGFLKGDHRLKIAMLADLIRADARLAASVRVHTMQLAPTEAASWLAQEGFWPREVAVYETERLLADADAGAPALGRLSLLALRDDVQRAKGASFSQREFHDRVLSYGSAPVSAVRKVMLPGEERPLLPASK